MIIHVKCLSQSLMRFKIQAGISLNHSSLCNTAGTLCMTQANRLIYTVESNTGSIKSRESKTHTNSHARMHVHTQRVDCTHWISGCFRIHAQTLLLHEERHKKILSTAWESSPQSTLSPAVECVSVCACVCVCVHAHERPNSKAWWLSNVQTTTECRWC